MSIAVKKILSSIFEPLLFLADRAIRFTLKRPWLGNILYSIIIKFPWFYRRIYNFAAKRGIITSSGVNLLDLNKDKGEDEVLLGLSPRARFVYNNLSKAIKKYRDRNE